MDGMSLEVVVLADHLGLMIWCITTKSICSFRTKLQTLQAIQQFKAVRDRVKARRARQANSSASSSATVVSRPDSGQLTLATPGQEDVSRPVGASASVDAPSTASGEAPPQVVHTVAEEVRNARVVVIEDSSSNKAVSTVAAVEDSSSNQAVSTVAQEDGGSSEAAEFIGAVSGSLEQQVESMNLLGEGDPGDGDGTGGDEQLLGSEEDEV